jgi:hypothetical protein
MHDIVKIGYSERPADVRASELFTTGVPTPFIVTAYWNVDDTKAQSIEKDIHNHLNPYRLSNNREFFKIEAKEAEKLISDFLGNYSLLELERMISKAENDLKKYDEEQKTYLLQKEKRKIEHAHYNLLKKTYEIKTQAFELAEKKIGLSDWELKFKIKSKYQKIHPLINIPAAICTFGLFPQIMDEIGKRAKDTEEQIEAKKVRHQLHNERLACLVNRIIEHFHEYGLSCTVGKYSHSYYYITFLFDYHYLELKLNSRDGFGIVDSHARIFLRKWKNDLS